MIWVRRAHLLVAWALVAGLVIQVFLAGLGVFENPSAFGTHAGWGFLLGLVILVLLVLAAISGVARRQVLYALALLGMFIVQSILASMRSSAPTLAALHPLNGFAILFVSIAMAREAWRARAGDLVAAGATPRSIESTAGS
jgi:uncharacterized protein DUF6220